MATIAKHPGDNLITRLKKSAIQLEELQVQLALGKAEATDKYEEVKKKFVSYLRGTKKKIVDTEINVENIIHADIDELQVQLALGKAETRDQFNEQKKRIFRAVNKLDKRLQVMPNAEKADENLRHEMETFRIKLELLDLHYDLGMMDARDELEKRKHDLQSALEKLKAKYESKKAKTGKQLDSRAAELKEAYRHLKKAVVVS